MADRRGLLARLLQDICDEIGATLTLHDDFGRFGTILYPNGASARFKGTSFDINGLGAYKIADDKDYTAKLLAAAGLNSAMGCVVVSPAYLQKLASYSRDIAAEWDPFGDAKRAFANYGFPLFIKPNIGSEGIGVRKVHDETSALAHLETLFQRCDTVLIQPPVEGRDFRLVVLDGDVKLAYERVPFSVFGDGERSLRALLAAHVEEINEAGRYLNLSALEPLIFEYTGAQGFGMADIPAEGQRVVLLPNANLSTGGTSVDVTGRVAPGYVKLCQKVMEVMGLRFAGIDLLARDIESFVDDHCVLEVNPSPGLHNFHAESPATRESVRVVYKTMLEAMGA